MGKGWPVVACPSRALVVLYRMLTIFAFYVLIFMFGMLFLFITTSLGCFVHGFCLSNNGLSMLPWTSFTCYAKSNKQGCFRLSNWFSLRRLGPWMNHLPSAWLSTFRLIFQNESWYVSLEWYFIYSLFLASVHGFMHETSEFFYSIITFSYTKYFVHSYTVDVVFTLSYGDPYNRKTAFS